MNKKKRNFSGGYQPIDTGELQPPPPTGSKIQLPIRQDYYDWNREYECMYTDATTCLVCGEHMLHGKLICEKCQKSGMQISLCNNNRYTLQFNDKVILANEEMSTITHFLLWWVNNR